MKGLKVSKRGSFRDKVHQYSNELSLLERIDDVELMLQTVFKDRLFYLYPSDDKNVTEFIYILNGEMEYERDGERVILEAHDFFTVKDLTEPVYFIAKTDVTYLWIINESIYKTLSNEIRFLYEITKKVESKDRYTFKHSERVANYSVKIAKQLNLTKHHLNDLSLAAEIHDIGKINIPVEILNKPGKLTKK